MHDGRVYKGRRLCCLTLIICCVAVPYRQVVYFCFSSVFVFVLYTGKDCRDSTVAVSMEATWPRVIVPACGPRVNSRKWPDLV